MFLESGLLTDEQVSAFQNATSGFLEKDADLNNGKLTDSYVQVTSQKVVDISNDASVMANKTNEVSTLTLQQALELTFTVSATYTGSVVNLNWKETLTKYFHDPESRWYRWLGAADSVFEPITPEPTPEEKAAAAADAASASQSDWTKEGGDRNGLVAVVSVLSVLALLLGVAASIYTIRKFKDTDFVQELGSQTFTSTSLGSRIANENMEYHARQFEKPHSPDRNTRNRSSGERGLEVDSATSAWVREPKSPNSMEIGDVLALDQIVSRNSSIPKTIEDPWNQIQPNHSNESKTSKDPPTNRSEVDFPIQTTKEHSRNMMSLFDNNVSPFSDFPFRLLMHLC